MSFENEAKSTIPVLPDTHSGIPTYLLEKAKNAKAAVFETRTKLQSRRQRLPVLPQGVDGETFKKALDDLKKQLGADHVELNDKPLVDGWYVVDFVGNISIKLSHF